MSAAFYSFINSVTNPITSKYEIKSQISTSGLWKIYRGKRKTSGKEVALFIFEKKTIDNSGFRRERSKQDSEAVYELLKKEAGNLAKLRHPSILEIVEPMAESRNSIVFVTEPLIGCLTHLVKSSECYSSDSSDTGLDLDELEIQKGLLQVGKGLQFFNDAKVVHHNLNTDAIFVNAKGDWKIGSLGFGVFLNHEGASRSYEYNDLLHEACQIDLDYAAPESVLNNDVCQANDLFALGCLAYAVHNKGVSILKTFNSQHSYQKQVETIDRNPFSNMPTHLRPVLALLFSRQPSCRMTAMEFQNSKYFDNILVSTIRFLEGFPEKTREEKAQFMKGLPKVLTQFPERVIKRKILPSLLEELKNSQLLPYTIPNIMNICLKLDQHEFSETVLPHLKPVFLVRDPPQNMIVLLEKLDILQSKTSRETFRDDVIPLVYASLESPTAIVQEKSLRIIPSLAESLDYTTVKSSLFPRVQAVFSQTTVLSVKVSTLICFHSMVKVLDKFTIQEKLVPGLKNIKTKEPAVMLATLAVYDEIGKTADKEIVATEILPQLWKMSFGPLLNLEQFQKFMKTIRELTDRVEVSHIRHLKEAKSLEEQTHNASSLSKINDDISNSTNFESLVQGTSSAKNSLENVSIKAATDNTPLSTTLSPWSLSALSLSDVNHQQNTKYSWGPNQTDLISSNIKKPIIEASRWDTQTSVMTPTNTASNKNSPSHAWDSSFSTTQNIWNSSNTPNSKQFAQKNSSISVMTMNQMSVNNEPNNSLIKSFSGSSPSIPSLKPPSMNALQNTTSYSNTPSATTNGASKKFDFHAFDPLA